MNGYRAAGTPLSMGPLVEFLTKWCPHTGQEGYAHVSMVTPAVTVERLGYTRRTYHRWKATGLIPAASADALCVRLGVHPTEIWGQEWEVGEGKEVSVGA